MDNASKRVLDLVLASAVLVIAAPLILCLALMIVVDSRGGIFYRCSRVGHNGRTMSMLKFRKMHRGASGIALTTANDERFTRTGRFLARTKLDEVPQLWNVLKGDMSLVGPRPEDPEFVERFRDDYAEILRAKPGITGLSQLAFAKESEIIDVDDPVQDYVSRLLPQKIALDRYYAQHRSLLLDVKILSWTAAAVILRRNVAVHRSSGRMSRRRRPNEYSESNQTQVA
jgi:lipopolysaccharide/colanic/teichoic acid biosynthesis glycosyltransferase